MEGGAGRAADDVILILYNLFFLSTECKSINFLFWLNTEPYNKSVFQAFNVFSKAFLIFLDIYSSYIFHTCHEISAILLNIS